MKLLIDTVNEDFFISVIDKGKTITYRHLEKYIKKSEILPIIFNEIINELKISAKDFKEIYVVNGPGSFMGIRAGIVFSKTMAILTKAKLFSINNLKFISQGKDGFFYTDAKGGNSFVGNIKEGNLEMQLVKFKDNSLIAYQKIIKEPEKILSLFDEIKEIKNLVPTYYKEPRIGAG